MHHGAWSRLLIATLALLASSCRDRSEPISPEPTAGRNGVEQTLYVDSATFDWTRAARYRVVPEMAHGQVIGIRLFMDHSDAGSEPSAGFHSADRIEAVDGVPLRTTDAAIEALHRIRDGRRVQFQVSRRGHLLRLVYRPREAAAPGE